MAVQCLCIVVHIPLFILHNLGLEVHSLGFLLVIWV
jgi:hypothetical protein